MANYAVPDNWASLPVKEAVMGGIKKKVKIDEENDIIYLLDENGDWTGEKCHRGKPSGAGTAPGSSNNAESKQEDGDGKEEAPKKHKKRQKSKMTPVLLIIIAILGAVLLWQNFGNTITQGTQVSVIVATRNIQAGEVIDVSKVTSLEISLEEYRKYNSQGGLYLVSEYPAIMNFVATTFIPVNGYISYNNVAPTYQAVNPWTLPGGKDSIIIPIDTKVDSLEEFMWGNKVTVHIQATRLINTKDYPEGFRPYCPEVTGSSELVTTQKDSYVLPNVTIVDMLNTYKSSLYSNYLAMSDVPAKYQTEHFAMRYSTMDTVFTDTPAYIKIAVDPQTAEWWKILNRNFDYTITVYLEKTGIDCETEFQSNTYQAIKAILPNIQTAWAAVNKEE